MLTTAPILLFTYKRLDTLTQTVVSLKDNYLAAESDLFIFSDGGKDDRDQANVTEIRAYIKSISGFQNVYIFESNQNNGLADSIISGVSKIINDYGKVIVLEDDLITSKNFLSFLNQALIYYKNNSRVFSIGGYTRPITGLSENEIYFTKRASSWGWATWKDRWNMVDWEVNDYFLFCKNRLDRKRFNEMGSDMAGMLDKQMRGDINSWAIRWCYHQFKNNLVTVYPGKSKVKNIGFGEFASHTKGIFNSFNTELDEEGNTTFIFTDNLILDKKIMKQFLRPYSISERVKNKVLNALSAF